MTTYLFFPQRKILIKNRGFTLIELLVVIAIIGTLASVILISINSARAKSRDAQRIHDLGEMQKAIELYYDKYLTYPRPCTSPGFTYAVTSFTSGWNTCLEPVLKNEGFIPFLPRDPTNNGSIMVVSTGYTYRYEVDSTGQSYDILARLETNSSVRCGNTQYRSKVLTAFLNPQYSMCTTNASEEPNYTNSQGSDYTSLYVVPH